MAYSTLKNLVFLIASGSRNLGRTCAINIVRRGGRVILCDTHDRKASGEEIQDALGEEHCLFVTADLSQEKDARNVINLTQEKFGKLDVTINCPDNAASGKVIRKNNFESIINEEYMESLFKSNVTSTFNVCRLSAELMAKNTPDANGQRGVIINKSHVLGISSSLVPYTISQAAIIGMTLPMARDLQDIGVRVNSIAIGIYPYQVPSKKGLVLQLLCSLMAFPHQLGSEDTFYHLCEKVVLNNYVNGEVIRLDGGLNSSIL